LRRDGDGGLPTVSWEMESGDVLAFEDFDDDDAPLWTRPGLSLSDAAPKQLSILDDDDFTLPSAVSLPPATYATGSLPAAFAIKPRVGTPPLSDGSTISRGSYSDVDFETQTPRGPSSGGAPATPRSSAKELLDASYKLGVPLADVVRPGTSSVRATTPRFVSSFFGRQAPVEIEVPDNCVLASKAESHFGGVVDDPRSCKIFGKAVVWLTPTEIVVRGAVGAPFTWRLCDLKICRATTTFEHGSFNIDETGGLGVLLELQGRCRAAEKAEAEKAKDLATKMAAAGHVHLAVRGLANVGEWVERVRQLKQQS